MVILVDDEDRENEGDLVMAADKVTPEAINFMARFGRGLICLTLTEEWADHLQLPLQSSRAGGPPLGTAFTVSIEAKLGVTSGISAADRAHTILTAVAKQARPDDLVTPGHIFPLRAKRGGTLVRTGHTEGSVDLLRLAGLTPAAVICEIMNDDGTMARMPDLLRFAEVHGLLVLSIADIIEHRLQTESLVEKIEEFELTPTIDGVKAKTFSGALFRTAIEPTEYLALWLGNLQTDEPVLTRVQNASLPGDVFGALGCDSGAQLQAALRIIDAAGRGVLLYVFPTGRFNVRDDLRAHLLRRGDVGSSGSKLRDFGLGAQVLRELGVQAMRLLTNNPKKIAGLTGHGLQLVESIPLLPKLP
ncbi:MAG: 3,4-dihydroxy-2-butanone-4-phosphate synthase [Deltaproteobacteria bacterium]|nr:3,4-dihydroxy-2-butanone-4-phosphate synthase [Deltaproteobacteria bacterium]